MEYLNVKQTADILGYSERHTKRLIANGKIKAVWERNNKNRPCYKIPLSELSPDAQYRYYKQHGIEAPNAEPKKVPEKKQKNLDYEKLSNAQREQVSLWIRIIEDWQSFVCTYEGSKTEANKAFVEQNADKYDVKISVNILYRKMRTYRSGNVADLVDGRGLKRKGLSCIDENLWQAFLYYYLDQAQHPVQSCYDKVIEWAKDHPELPPIPSISTFYRHIESDVADPLETYARKGVKAYRDKYGFYIRREYKNMSSNDVWVADNNTFDVMVKGDNGKPKRMHLTAFMDARSGIFTGVYITNSPSAQATIYALRRGIIKYGIPKEIYVDNGREFLVHDVGGLGHRQKKSSKDKQEIQPPPIFERLGIKMTNALVRNARAKIIERRFRDVKDRLSRLFDSYTGGNVLEKPERLKEVLKGDIIDEVEFTRIVEDMLNYNFNYQEYGGSVASDRGKKRIDVYNTHLIEKRVASEEDLWLMMLRSTRPLQVGKRGVHITVAGRRLDYCNDELHLHWQGKKVYIRYDPENLSTVRVYDLEDRYITTAQCADDTVLEYGADKETVSAAVKEERRMERLVREGVKNSRVVALGAKSAMDIVLCEIENNKRLPVAESNPIISIHRADEEQYEPFAQAVGSENTVMIDRSRMIQNIENRKED